MDGGTVRKPAILMAFGCLAAGCGGGGGGETPLPPAPPQPVPQVTREVITGFSDVTAASGIAFEVGFARPLADADLALTVPSGVAAGDYDGDGLVDLVIVRGDTGPNLLYRNLGGLRFEELAEDAGIAWSRRPGENLRHGSPGLADLDGDGDLDLLLPGLGYDSARLYRNDGDGTFSDATRGSGLDLISAEYSFSPAFGDYDLDGDLDLLLAHWGYASRPLGLGCRDGTSLAQRYRRCRHPLRTGDAGTAGLLPDILDPDDPLLTRNDDDYTFSPSFARINGDRHPDVLMVADFNHTQVFHNLGDGTFVNATDVDVIIDGNGMGSALGDYDNDGDLDWFVSSILGRGLNVPAGHIGARKPPLSERGRGFRRPHRSHWGGRRRLGMGQLLHRLRERWRPRHLSHQRAGRMRTTTESSQQIAAEPSCPTAGRDSTSGRPTSALTMPTRVAVWFVPTSTTTATAIYWLCTPGRRLRRRFGGTTPRATTTLP